MSFPRRMRCAGTAKASAVSRWDERAMLEDRPNFCTCGECHGRRVVLVVDEDRLTEEQQTILTEVDAAERELAEESRLRAAGYQF